MAKNWYPVINTETCSECGKCIEKCSHGVYDKNSPQKPVIVYTDGCVDGCHGCGNLCTTGSITYSGDSTGWEPPNLKSRAQAASCCKPQSSSCCEAQKTSSSPRINNHRH